MATVQRHVLDRRSFRTKVGQRIHTTHGDYLLRGLLGTGAAGVVRKAGRLSDGRIVAIKFLAPDPKYISVSAFDDVAGRFKREGLRGAALEHEGLVRIHHYEENTGGRAFRASSVLNPFIVMDYVRGGTLEGMLQKLADRTGHGMNITPTSLSIAVAIARGLEYLHTNRIVHRDVKPANVFVSRITDDGPPAIVRLGDFGVTKWGDFLAALRTGTLTVSHHVGLGTMKYMAPEQAFNPRLVTAQADIFSFGVLLFELFTGTIQSTPLHVFSISTTASQRGAVAAKLHALGLTCRGLEEPIMEFVLSMLTVRPESRPKTANVAGTLNYYLDRVSGA